MIDGLLFPLLALVFTYGARLLVDDYQRLVLLKIAVPILISLAGIRFLARVLTLVFDNPKPAALLANLGANGLEFSLLFWIDDPVNGQINVRSELNLRILKGLREAGIDIPYPQRVVHIGSPPPAISSAKATKG